MNLWCVAACCVSAVPAFASSESPGYTGHYTLSGSKNPDSVGVAGISIIKFDGGVGIENAAAIPMQRNRLSFYSQRPQSFRRSTTEKDTTGFYGAEGSFAAPNRFAALGLGMGVHRDEQNTVFSPNSEETLSYELFDTELRGAVGVLLFDELSIGVGPAFSFGQETIARTAPGQKIESQSFNSLATRVSAQYSHARFRSAAAWKSESKPATQKTLLPRDGGELGKPYKPAELTFAAGYAFPSIRDRMSAFPLQLDVLAELGFTYFPNLNGKLYRSGSRVYQRTYALYIPFVETPTQQPQELETRTRTTPRIAVDARVFEVGSVRLNASMGTWTEPGMVRNEQEKNHLTTGLALGLWGFKTTIALDQANKQRTLAFGVGAQYER
jgi:hypothetical protein